jgi:hypothetical protein
MTGSDWNDDTQGEQAAGNGEQHLPTEPAASESAYASWPQDTPTGGPSADQGTPAGAQGTPPGYQGAPPGAQGTPPGYQGAPPGAQGTPPGYQGAAGGGWPGSATPSDTVEFGDSTPSSAPRPRRRLVVATSAGAVAAVAVAAIAIAATGGFSSSQSPAQVLAAAAHNSSTVSSLSATYSEQISGQASGSISGSVQEIRKPLQMSIGMTETINGQTLPLSAILTDSDMYMKFGSVAGLPAELAGKWIEFSLSSVGGGEFSSLLQSVQNENPTSQAQELLAAKDLRADGTQVVDGVQTNKYTGSFTPAAALKVLSPAARAALGPAMKEIQGDINFSVWIDGNDHIRKFTEVETVASETVNATFTFQSFNQPVTVTIPPASEVVHYPGGGL